MADQTDAKGSDGKKPVPTANDERRTTNRYRTRALTDGDVVAAPSAGHAFLGSTVNVSKGGALVRTYESLELEQEVALTLHLPEGDLKVGGTVVHVRHDSVGCKLVGVKFGPLPIEAAELLGHHLETFGEPPMPVKGRKGDKSASSGGPLRMRRQPTIPTDGRIQKS
jgi:hypothetical protein